MIPLSTYIFYLRSRATPIHISTIKGPVTDEAVLEVGVSVEGLRNLCRRAELVEAFYFFGGEYSVVDADIIYSTVKKILATTRPKI